MLLAYENSNYMSDNSANRANTELFVYSFIVFYVYHPRIINTLADNNKSIAEGALRKRYLTLASSITDPYTI